MSTPYYKLPLLSLDTETTGINVLEDRVVSCNITYDYLDREPYICNWLINPGVPIPAGASAVHGITDEVAQRDGDSPVSALANIAEHLSTWDSYGLPIVVYNATFDISLLIAEIKRHGVSCTAMFDKVIDPLVIDKGLDPFRPGSRKLIDTAKHYGIELDNAHSADADSMASVRVAREIGRLAQIDDPIEVVHAQQKEWAKQQAESYQKYLREKKNDYEKIIDTRWPYRLD